MPLAISTVAFITFTTLLWLGNIGEASFSFLVAATALFGLVLHGFSRLQELDLKNLRLVLREIKETKQELFVREEKLKSIIVPLVHLLAYTGAAEGRWTERETAALKHQWYKKKLFMLIESLDFNSQEAIEARKFIEKYDEIDRLFAGRGALQTTDPDYPQVKNRIDLLNQEIKDMLKRDIDAQEPHNIKGD